MGYHCASSKKIPSKFNCFDCRVRADRNWDLIMVHDLHPRMMDKFRDLALFRYVLFIRYPELLIHTVFRRAIKISEKIDLENGATFAKSLGVLKRSYDFRS